MTIYARDGGCAAVIYFASLFVFWQIAGRPDGFEAKAIALLKQLFLASVRCYWAERGSQRPTKEPDFQPPEIHIR